MYKTSQAQLNMPAASTGTQGLTKNNLPPPGAMDNKADYFRRDSARQGNVGSNRETNRLH